MGTRFQKVCFVLSPTHLSITITIWTGGYPVKTRLSGQIPARFGAVAVYGQAKAAEAVPSITLLVKWENPTPFSSAMDLDLLIESEHVRQEEVLKFSVSGSEAVSSIAAGIDEGYGWDISFYFGQLFVLLLVGYCYMQVRKGRDISFYFGQLFVFLSNFYMQVRQGPIEAVPSFAAEPPSPKEAAQNFVADPFTHLSQLKDEIQEAPKVPSAPSREREVYQLGNASRFEEPERPSWEKKSDCFTTASRRPSCEKKLDPSITGLEFNESERPPEASA